MMLNPLTKKEAWSLFQEKLGEPLCSKIIKIAKSMTEKCNGFPLGIVTAAGSMKGIYDVCEWNDALRELQFEESKDGIFGVLRFSFNRLSYTLQQCFLYCALFPKGYEIEREELIEYLIVEGIIKAESRQAAFEIGHTILNRLEEVYLLEGVEYRYVRCMKMHYLFHDMAIEIMRKNRVMVEADAQLAEIPDCRKWAQDLVRVSLMDNDIEEISHGHSPKCPNLSTLLLRGNYLMSTIADSFFQHLSGIKVLDLSGSGIHELPSSVSDLVSLNALLLADCELLSHVPSLAKLKALKNLDLLRCYGIEQIPLGIECLCNLRYLDLRWTQIKELPAGILPNLPHLQVLLFGMTLIVKAEELISLTKLETLECCFYDLGEFNTFSLTPLINLNKYTLLVGQAYLRKEGKTRSAYLSKCYEGETSLFLPDGLESLEFHYCNFQGNTICLSNVTEELKSLDIFGCDGIQCLDCFYSSPSIFQNLKKISISFLNHLLFLFSATVSLSPLPSSTFLLLKGFEMSHCARVKKLFCLDIVSNLQNLENLEIYECENMEEIISNEEGQEASNYRNCILPRLKSLKLKGLPELKCIWNGKIECNCVKEIQVVNCVKLKRMPLSLIVLTENKQPSPLQSLERIQVFPEQWWESVELDHPNANSILLPLCYFADPRRRFP